VGHKSKMIRPIYCVICKGSMYYSEDPRHVPEIYIDITYPDGKHHTGYAHQECWEKFEGHYIELKD
jgi:hypothetical protein